MQTVFWSTLIFIAMVLTVVSGTIRLLAVKLKKIIWAGVCFFQAALSAAVIMGIIQNPNNTIMVLLNVLGFALGLYTGILISDKICAGIYATYITSKNLGHEIEKALEDDGFKVTCYNNADRGGDLKVLKIISKKKHLLKMKQTTNNIDRYAFIMSYNLSECNQGSGHFEKEKKVLLLNNCRSEQ